MDTAGVWCGPITYQCICEWPSLIGLYLDTHIYLSLNICGQSPLKVILWKIVSTGSWKTNPSCSNNTGKFYFAFFQFYQTPPRGWLLVGRQLSFRKWGSPVWTPSWSEGSGGAGGHPGRVTWLMCWALGRTACPLAPTSRGPTYTIDLMGWEVQRAMGMKKKKKIFQSHMQTLESQALEWSQLLPWKPLRRVLKATRSSPGNVPPFDLSLH